jgi:hypothetical protein
MDTHSITPDYLGLIINAFEKIDRLQVEREKLDAEIMKQEQFISATANFLPDDQRDLVSRRMAIGQSLQNVRESSLTNAIRTILRQESGNWLTVTNVRDRLLGLGFDFSDYSTNPLASVSTILRRMKSEEVETRNVDGGVAAFRWKDTSELNLSPEFLKAAMKGMLKDMK